MNSEVSARGVHVVVLAAGQGTRMRSSGPKVLHTIAGQTLLGRVLSVAEAIGPASITVVVGQFAGYTNLSIAQLRKYVRN